MDDLKIELQNRLKKLVSEESNQLSTDVSLLFESTSISENDQEKFLDIIESTVQSKVLSIAESTINEMAENVNEYAEYVRESLEVKAEEYGNYVVEETTSKLNSYLEYVTSEYMKENKLAISNGIKADLFESLVTSMKEIFVENNIIVPEEGVDVVSELQEEVNEQTTLNDKLVTENTSLKAQVSTYNKEKVISEATANLVLTQKEKVLELVESLEYNDEFQSKLKNIVEFVSKKSSKEDSLEIDSKQNITEQKVIAHKNVNHLMDAYIKSAAGNSTYS